MHSLFITGTDTDVGKTAVTAALALCLSRRFAHVLAVKPVQTGCLRTPAGLTAPDVQVYEQAGVTGTALELFEPAASPELAARLAGRTLSVAALVRGIQQCTRSADFSVIEGAGGVLVPLSETQTMADLMRGLDTAVVLVVGNRLGCINQALLSIEALQNRGIRVLGMILNRTTPPSQCDAGAGDDAGNQERFLNDNEHRLRQSGAAVNVPLLASLPYSAGGVDLTALSFALEPVVHAFLRDEQQRCEQAGADALFDHEHLWHPYCSALSAPAVPLVTGAHDCTLSLSDGRTLIDGTSSWWCAWLGYGNPSVVRAVQQQAARLPHVMFGGLTHQPAVALGRRLLSLVPPSLQHIFYADSGSVAVEVAMKLAVQYWRARGDTRRNQFLTPLGGYHGDTAGAMSVCDPVNGMHGLFRGIVREQIFIERPACRFDAPFDPESLEPVAKAIAAHRDTLAALILEPIVQGAGGMWFYHPDYLRGVRALCDEAGILLIADEIATGFGRTGKLFACEWAGIVPDILCLGKALTAGTMTLSAVITTGRVAQTIDAAPAELGGGAFMHGPTFMANPLACAAACAALDAFSSSPWQSRVAAIEENLRTGLAAARDCPDVVDVRVLGAIGVVQLARRVNSRRLTEFFINAGVWVRPFGNLIYLMPPSTITTAELGQLTRSIVEALAQGIHQ